MTLTDKKERNKILTVLFIGVLMGALDIAIVGPALPAIQKQFGLDERAVAWIFAVYVLFNLVGTPLLAKLSDIMSRRKIYIFDVILFAAGSLVVALSPNFTTLLIGRSIQGFGAGGIFPVASAVIGDTFPEDKRGGALGLIGAVFGIAFIIGPAVAGVLLLLSWHWLFIVNIPIALVIIVMSLRILPDNTPEHKKPFDWNGMIFLAIILTALAYGFNKIDSSDFLNSLLSLNVWPFLIFAILLLPFFVSSEKKAHDPILRLQLLTSRQVILVSALAIGAGISEAAVVFVPPLLVSSFHVTNSQASFMLIPIVIAMAIGSPLAGRMLDKMGSKIVLIVGTLILALGMFGLAYESSAILSFYVSAFFLGIGMGFLVGAPLRYIMLNEAKKSERASGQGVVRLFTGTGQLFGGALVGAVAASQGGGALGLRNAYLMVGVMIAVLVLISFGLKSRSEELKTAQENV
jgi:EmrB/QacA subfamily drug resistance transporter